ncbi:MAG: ricin-type beta-trefoil lectin domain protein [Ramlibacter sp.]|nr:ricin-type beta-trefoil lectin domain protein [Ramlibacter sp.]
MSRHNAPAGPLPLNAIAASIALLLSACGGGEPEEDASQPLAALAQDARPLAAATRSPAVVATTTRIQEQSADQCLVVPAAPAPGVVIGLGACTESNELFDILPVASGSSAARLRVSATTLCATVKAAKKSAGAKLVLAACATGAEQQFDFRPVASGDIQLVAQHSLLCLEARGAAISQQSCDTSAKRLAQLFQTRLCTTSIFSSRRKPRSIRSRRTAIAWSATSLRAAPRIFGPTSLASSRATWARTSMAGQASAGSTRAQPMCAQSCSRGSTSL